MRLHWVGKGVRFLVALPEFGLDLETLRKNSKPSTTDTTFEFISFASFIDQLPFLQQYLGLRKDHVLVAKVSPLGEASLGDAGFTIENLATGSTAIVIVLNRDDQALTAFNAHIPQ